MPCLVKKCSSQKSTRIAPAPKNSCCDQSHLELFFFFFCQKTWEKQLANGKNNKEKKKKKKKTHAKNQTYSTHTHTRTCAQIQNCIPVPVPMTWTVAGPLPLPVLICMLTSCVYQRVIVLVGVHQCIIIIQHTAHTHQCMWIQRSILQSIPPTPCICKCTCHTTYRMSDQIISEQSSWETKLETFWQKKVLFFFSVTAGKQSVSSQHTMAKQQQSASGNKLYTLNKSG